MMITLFIKHKRAMIMGVVSCSLLGIANAFPEPAGVSTIHLSLPAAAATKRAPLNTSESADNSAGTLVGKGSFLKLPEQHLETQPPVHITKNSSVKKLTLDQEDLLLKAKDIGQEVGLPETLQVILLQETWAGQLDRVASDGLSYGVTQVKPSTAKEITQKHKTSLSLNDKGNLDDYKLALLVDDEYAITVAGAYIHLLHKQSGKDWPRTVVSYNWGPTGARSLSDEQISNTVYFKNIRQKMRIVRDFNQRHNELVLQRKVAAMTAHKYEQIIPFGGAALTTLSYTNTKLTAHSFNVASMASTH